jgi:glycosyltransferase involved in cell wall biosynthesis
MAERRWPDRELFLEGPIPFCEELAGSTLERVGRRLLEGIADGWWKGSGDVPVTPAATCTSGSAERPRALVVSPQPFYVDRGTPIAVRYVLTALSELGWETELLCFPEGGDVTIPGVAIHRVGNPLGIRRIPVGFSPQKLVLDALLARVIRKRLVTGHYDVVHGVEEAAILLAALKGRNGPPLVYDMASSLPEQLAQKRLFRVPPLPGIFEVIERWVLAKAAVVVCSAGLEDRVKAIAPATPLRPWRFPADAPLASSAETLAARRKLGIPDTAPIVLYTGNFATYQGIELLCGAATRILGQAPEAFLVLVGAADDAEIAATRGRLPREHLDRVRLIGRQPREAMGGWLALADILISPRSYGVNFPLKLFDYLATGKPIVATDIVAHRCILDQRIAVLVPPTPKGLADGIVQLLANPAEAAALGAAAGRFAAEHLSWNAFVRMIDDLYATARRRATERPKYAA